MRVRVRVRVLCVWCEIFFVWWNFFLCVSCVMRGVVECGVCVVMSLCGVPTCVCGLASQLGVPNWGGSKMGGVQRVPNELFIKVWDPVHTSVHTCAHTCAQCVHSV